MRSTTKSTGWRATLGGVLLLFAHMGLAQSLRVAAVTLPAAGVYTSAPGHNVLRFEVDYTQVVTVNDPWYGKADDGSDTPSLPIQLDGGRSVEAQLIGGSITRTLIFAYTVQPGDKALRGIALDGAVQMNGATITNGSGVNAIETLTGYGPTGAIIVDAAGTATAGIEPTPALTPLGCTLLAFAVMCAACVRRSSICIAPRRLHRSRSHDGDTRRCTCQSPGRHRQQAHNC